MKTWRQRCVDWLERRWVAPAYAGWLVAGLSIFFFAAATNTMAGWLYVMSAGMMAILAIAAVLPKQLLKGLAVERSPIEPVSQGEMLTVELVVENRTGRVKPLLQISDRVPRALGGPVERSLEQVPTGDRLVLRYESPTECRGIFRWETVTLRTAAPLGLCWCRREWHLPARAIVYPQVLPLAQCPLVDAIGRDEHVHRPALRANQTATEGITRTLRPYRWGDPMRMIHWRSSARYGELRVRELELITGGEAIVLAIDTAPGWQPHDFEQAVVAAASLYWYASKQGLPVQLWTAETGVVGGDRAVMEVLAAIQPGESKEPKRLPELQRVWLTHRAESLDTLPSGSRWLLWPSGTAIVEAAPDRAGRIISAERSLQSQLQSPLAAGSNMGG